MPSSAASMMDLSLLLLQVMVVTALMLLSTASAFSFGKPSSSSVAVMAKRMAKKPRNAIKMAASSSSSSIPWSSNEDSPLAPSSSSSSVVPSHLFGSSAGMTLNTTTTLEIPTETETVQKEATQVSEEIASQVSKDVILSSSIGEDDPSVSLPSWKLKLTQLGMYLFIASMCVALPATLIPQHLLFRLKLIDRLRQERWALATGQWCARWLLRLIPFCKVDCHNTDSSSILHEPAVWVCNHTSALDIFLLLAIDRKLRGKNKRPIKIVYWEQLEENPVTKLLFRQCGFIPVAMADNGSGTDNDYDVSSFKRLLQQAKQAFEEGFDIGILPEGQLNPTPEKGLLPCFAGAYTLARLSRPRRPIKMMALQGAHKMWHPDPKLGFTNVSGRHVNARVYDNSSYDLYDNSDEFLATFSAVVGHFGATGRDIEDLDQWMAGTHPTQVELKGARKKGKKKSE